MPIVYAIILLIIGNAVWNDLIYRKWETSDYVLWYTVVALISLLILTAVIRSVYESFKKRTSKGTGEKP